MQLLITSDGKVRPATAPELYRDFGFIGSNDELLNYSVRNLGAVIIRVVDDCWRIEVRADFLPRSTFETLVELMAEYDPYRIVIEQTAVGQNLVEIFINVADVISRLENLRDGYNSEARRSRFAAHEMAVSRLRTLGRPKLAASLKAWRRHDGVLSRPMLKRLLDEPIGGDLLLSRMDKSDVPITETMPGYITFWGNTSLADLIGKPMTDHPDQEYTAGAAKGFAMTHFANKPLLEVVDALIVPKDGPAKQLRYDRLLLPWRAEDGTRFVTSASFTRVERFASAAA